MEYPEPVEISRNIQEKEAGHEHLQENEEYHPVRGSRDDISGNANFENDDSTMINPNAARTKYQLRDRSLLIPLSKYCDYFIAMYM
ncbi:hypothetical protein JTB14_030861 [Gonioctena quinquepunctata]|nr:hypothetical protein JTB14_030861 [Gonioctena quinquepunctata]